MPRSYRDDSPPRRGGGSTRVAEYEREDEVEVSHRRGPRRDRPEWLEEDYGRSSHAGPLVIRDEEVIEERRRGGSRRPPRDEEYERDLIDEEVTSKPSRHREKSRTRHFEEEEIRYRGPKGGGKEFFEEEEEDKKSRTTRGGRRERERDYYEEDEVRSTRGPKSTRGGYYEEDDFRYEKDDFRYEKKSKDRSGGREEIKEEIIYHGKPKPTEVTKEEWTYRPGPAIARETEEWTFAPAPRREPDRERVYISERNREPDSPPARPKERYSEEEIIINQRDKEPPRRPAPPKDDYREEIKITTHDREPSRGPPQREYRDSEIKFRHTSPPPRPRSEYHGDEIKISQREREVDPPGPNNAYRQEDTKISFRESEGRRPRSVYGGESRYRDHRDDVSIYERDREGPRGHSDELVIRHSSPSRERPRAKRENSFERNEISFTRRDRSEPPRDRDRGYDQQITIRHNDEEDTRSRAGGGREELTISRRERIPSPSPSPPPPPESYRPPPIRQEIHQEIITHHRHIDHGFEYRGAPPPPPPEPPKPPSPPSHDEIEIKRSGERNGRRYEENLIIDRRSSSPESKAPSRPRSVAPSTRAPPPAPSRTTREEIDFYRDERVYPTDNKNAGQGTGTGTGGGGTGTGGGASVNLTIVNGRRDSGPQQAPREPPRSEVEVRRRNYVGVKPKEESMWTEITKDLVVAEALTNSGYEFEETEHFFYVMEYLRYDDVARLVRISDDLRSRRKERTRQIEWESKMPSPAPPPIPAPLSPPPRAISERSWDQERERIVEREYFGGPGRSPQPPRVPRPPSRARERDTTITVRDR